MVAFKANYTTESENELPRNLYIIELCCVVHKRSGSIEWVCKMNDTVSFTLFESHRSIWLYRSVFKFYFSYFLYCILIFTLF